MQLHFFPRDRQFWIYHSTAVAAGLTLSVSLALMWGFMMRYQVTASLLWAPFYTMAALGFRWLYKRFRGDVAPMGRLIVFAVLYSAVAGLAIAVLLQASVLPLFWDIFESKYKRTGVPLSFEMILFQRIRDEMAPNQLFILVWCFMYVSVTSTRRVHMAETHNLRLQNTLKEAQLSSLSNQLNPHFLFNSLNNIRFMIHEDAQRADTMITSFSEILRYSLESSRHDKVALSEELAIINKYMSIVQTQLEQRLTFRLRIAPELHGTLVPPMVLQMLTENAIKHGLDQLQAGGTLTLYGVQKDKGVVFEVCNDAPAAPQKPVQGMGIGLRNIAQRLALLYGERAALDVTHEDNQFTVRLSLPMERAA